MSEEQKTFSPFSWVLGFAIIVLVCFKGYDYYLDFQIKQSKIVVTEQQRIEQDSINKFVSEGIEHCRKCKYYEQNRPSANTDIFIVVSFLVLFAFVLAFFIYNFPY